VNSRTGFSLVVFGQLDIVLIDADLSVGLIVVLKVEGEAMVRNVRLEDAAIEVEAEAEAEIEVMVLVLICLLLILEIRII